MGRAGCAQRWELENDVKEVDTIYTYNSKEQQEIMSQRPWTTDPRYFKHVRISALALIKMVMHARSGGSLEVMGLMQGKIDRDNRRGPTLVVMDAFALPVEGTETRVNAQADAYEYMVEYNSVSKEIGRHENVVGWYHSHPGYGCWMSGIDCSTQLLNQQYQEPFLAVVIDPVRTCSTGKVEIGAFRTYPAGYKPPEDGPSEYQSIPLSKIEDFGVHQNQCGATLPALPGRGRRSQAVATRGRYYQLDISFFKSSTDASLLALLWNKYWINTLSSSALVTNSDYMASQIRDLADKLEQAEGHLASFSRGSSSLFGHGGAERKSKQAEDSPLSKICRDSSKLTKEHIQGLVSQIVKNTAFNG